MNEIEALAVELKERRRQLEAASRMLLSRTEQGAGAGSPGGGGFAAGEVDRLNARIRQAQGIDVIEARIAELEALLGEA